MIYKIKRFFYKENIFWDDFLIKFFKINSFAVFHCRVNQSFEITYITDNLRRITGHLPNDFIQKQDFISNHIHPNDQKDFLIKFKNCTHRCQNTLEFRLKNSDGLYIPLYAEFLRVDKINSKNKEFVGIFQDLSKNGIFKKRFSKPYFNVSNFEKKDNITGLANEDCFKATLQNELIDYNKSKQAIALLLINVDDFIEIKGTFGPLIGDIFLKKTAIHLRNLILQPQTVFYIRENTYAILIKDRKCIENIEDISKNILKTISNPVLVSGQKIKTSCSIGIGFSPDHGQKPEELLKAAYSALAYSQKQGGACFHVYSNEMKKTFYEYLTIGFDLQGALQKGQLTLHYQPQVNLASGIITGAEALMRWQHPDKGMISPTKFIPVAEKNRFIDVLSEWAVREACRQNFQWRNQGLSPIKISVNISSRGFESNDLLKKIIGILRSTGIAPEWLELELTENSIIKNLDVTIKNMDFLKKNGISIAVDDFGKGQAWLSYLKYLPVNSLKIDKEFLEGISSDPYNYAIVSHTLMLAKTLNLSVVAEGIENFQQLCFLRSKGCETGQGFLFSQPLSADDIIPLLQRGKIDIDVDQGQNQEIVDVACSPFQSG